MDCARNSPDPSLRLKSGSAQDDASDKRGWYQKIAIEPPSECGCGSTPPQSCFTVTVHRLSGNMIDDDGVTSFCTYIYVCI